MRGEMRRQKCRACEKGCTPGGSAHKARVQRANIRAGRVQSLVCAACGLSWSRSTSLGRPPIRCADCRRSSRPILVINRRIVLGPCPCQGCGQALTWSGWGWEDTLGDRHHCDSVLAA